MRKISKVLIIFLMFFALISVCKTVEANSIEKISMDIFIEENGDAKITEVWECRTNQGTEVYHPYYNLGNSEIKDLTVSEGSVEYQTLASWNTNGTLSSKAKKCGINRISNGVELCWGISNYGKHTYTVNYTITNFVSELTDSQMIYWTLVPHNFSNEIGKAYIKIHTNFDIEDTIDVWGYGDYGGTAYVYDGYIEMQSNGSLASNEYMTILVEFPLDSFKCSNKLDYDFNHYFEMAEEGAVKYENDYDYNYNSGFNFGSMMSALITMMSSIIVPIFILIVTAANQSNKFTDKKYFKNILPNQKEIPYYRDIPCKKDILRAYYIAYKYKIIKEKDKSGLLGAIILKWLKDSMIRIEKKEVGLIFKKENIIVALNETDPEKIVEPKEKELFRMLYDASKDGYLESKEFERWCYRSYSKVLAWFDKIIKEQENRLIEEGIIQYEEVVKFTVYRVREHAPTDALNEEALQLAGFKKYLEDYTLIAEREALEVHLFEEYLIFAQILGIAEKVAKQFKDLYPEIVEQSHFDSYDNIYFVQICTNRGISNARFAEQEAINRANSYSSGGGGFSSGGGGGGSFGGGGGGGGFR